MKTTRILLLAMTAALVSTPPATAAWHAWGSTEPSTPHDLSDGMMWTDPDTSPATNNLATQANKVYFAGFVDYGVEGVGPNVNSGTLSTEFFPATGSVFALLGVWKDCNKDGFVGLGDQGLFEYRSTLLLDTSVCPPSSVPSTIPDNWVPPHNDGQWVHEFISIAWPGAYASGIDENKFNINDAGARAWYDLASPDATSAGLTCWENPPTGSLHSTGGMLYWGDCLATGYTGTDTFDSTADSNPATQPYSFSDANRTQYDSHSRANVENPWGWDSEKSYATTWDCSKPQTNVAGTAWNAAGPTVESQTGDQNGGPVTYTDDGAGVAQASAAGVTLGPAYLNVSQPKVPPSADASHPPSANGAHVYDLNGYSAAGTTNQTAAGFDQCGGNTASGGGRGGSTANTPYAAEAPVANKGPGRTQSDGVLVGATNAHRPGYCPRETSDGSCVSAGPASDNIGSVYESALGPGTPPGLGQHDVGVAGASFEGFWYDDFSLWTFPGFALDNDVTFYAHVSTAAIQAYNLWLPGGSPGVAPPAHTYGQEACQGATTGVINGWDCDKADWWQDATQAVSDISQTSPWLGPDSTRTGGCQMPDTTIASTDATTRGCAEISPYTGDSYELRDVNCYDSSTNTARAVVGPVHNPPAVGGTENGCSKNAGSL